jgi:putative oxidoreductase
MLSKFGQFEFFKEHSDYGTIFLRLLVGSFIIYGVQDNVFGYEHMKEFAVFLQQRNVPLPLFAAFLSAYTQFVCGIMILLGAWIRLAAIPFVINFIAAIVIAHLDDTFRAMFPALMMIAAGFFFLFHGAGKLSVDEILERRGKNVGLQRQDI